MKIMVTDRECIEAGFVVRTPYIVISIRDPGAHKPQIPQTTGLKKILDIAFHDAEPVPGFRHPSKIVLMKPTQAQTIWKFVRHHQRTIGAIVCHCEQGMSRSPAVALALAEVLGGDADHIRANYQPNQYVYGLMRQAIVKAGSGVDNLDSREGENE